MSQHATATDPNGPIPIPVFLDFEGVLRPSNSSGPLENARLLVAPLLAAEADGLSPLLAISSTHRMSHSVEELADILESHAPGLGRFVQSATPQGARVVRTQRESLAHDDAPRLFEIMAWMRAREPVAGWVAIDDSPSLFAPKGMPLPAQLMLCAGAEGLTAANAGELLSRLLAIGKLARASRLAATAGATPRP